MGGTVCSCLKVYSVFGTMLLSAGCDDIDHGIVWRILQFADDSKLHGIVCTTDEIQCLKDNLSTLLEWSICAV